MRNLDVTTLRSFAAVADNGGVTRAAGMLNLTQSAVSMQLKRLEEQLGTSLLDRSARKIALTPAGEQLLSYARRIVAINDEAVALLTEDSFEGEFTFGVPHDVVYPVIPQVLKAFNASFPRVRVHLLSSSTVSLFAAQQRGEVDMILTTEEGLRAGGETLTEMPLRWAGATGGQVWRRQPLKLAFCCDCIFRPIVLRKLDEAGIAWEMAIQSDEDRAIEAMVSADLAVTALLEDSVPPQQEPLPASSGLPELGRQKINLYGTNAHDPASRHFADLLRQGFARKSDAQLKSA